MSPSVEPPHSVILVVGREEFTPPSSFGGQVCTATQDCVAVAVTSSSDGPTTLTLSPEPPADELLNLGEFELETEGLLSVRDVYNREYDAMGATPGLARVVIWGDAEDEPSVVHVQAPAVASGVRAG
ncbi:MAG: hypothetical protein ABIO16_13025 [Nocardioides sp.]